MLSLFAASYLAYLLESDQDMVDKLNNAAMRAAQLRAELKAKKLSVPPPPKVGFFSLNHPVISLGTLQEGGGEL